jgi:chemotaxis protein methyltransferase CheR
MLWQMHSHNQIGPDIPDHLLARVSRLVDEQTGLNFPENRWSELRRGIGVVSEELGFVDAAEFVDSLLSHSLKKRQLDAFWRQLTVGETYFFRDKSLFQVLKENIFADWTASSRSRKKRYRIWSAGCCTGEEPYSLAILLDQLGRACTGFESTLLASDINSHFLAKAELGVYTHWSFRRTPDKIVEAYFKQRKSNEFEMSRHIRDKVTFFQLNLAAPDYPFWLNNAQKMDLILCRNVLMYFRDELRIEVVQRLSDWLVDGGWFVVSPSEAAMVRQPDFVPVRFPGAILFRKHPILKNNGIPASRPGRQNHPPATDHAKPYLPSGAVQVQRDHPKKRPENADPDATERPGKIRKPIDTNRQTYREALELHEKGRYRDSEQLLLTLLSRTETNSNDSILETECMTLLSKTFANQGRLKQARKWSEQAAAQSRLNPDCHYLLATIYQESGETAKAIKALKHTLYLDPNMVMADVALGMLALKQGKTDAWQKHLRNALVNLSGLDSQDVLPNSEGMTAGQIVYMLESIDKEQR